MFSGRGLYQHNKLIQKAKEPNHPGRCTRSPPVGFKGAFCMRISQKSDSLGLRQLTLRYCENAGIQLSSADRNEEFICVGEFNKSFPDKDLV